MKYYFSVLISLSIMLAVTSTTFSMGPNPEPPKPYCETQYPVILVPGVTGFDTILGFVDYWYGIPDDLEQNGAVVFPVSLSGWQSTEERGDQLLRFIDTLMELYPEYEKFNIIAHSHGATTSRYAMHHRPEVFASLTTIAGPHQGTPAADYLINDIPDMLQPVAFGGIELLTGDLVALLSGHSELIGTQDAEACAKHFSIEGIQAFNNDYPCVGVPKECSEGLYGEDCTTQSGSFYGNGRGEQLTPSDPGAIRFYSWTGNVGTGSITTTDLLDSLMVVINGMVRANGYEGDADGFVPVASAHFGEVLSDSYYWNHFDEINQALGFISPFAANPKSVFRQHLNRLQTEGY